MKTSNFDMKKVAIASAVTAAIAIGGAGFAQAGTTLSGHHHSSVAASEKHNVPQPRHGFVGNTDSDVTARAALKANTDLGSVQWEPQSLEAPKGFPQAGPADGKIASAGTALGANLDEQTSTRWVKNEVRPGDINIGWNFTAAHKTSKWHYYITKNGWDQNAPLTRSELEPLATVAHDGSAASGNPTHKVSLPADHTGYHVILAVWDVADTANAFYNVIDVDINSSHEVPDNNPVDPVDPVDPDDNPGEDPDNGVDTEAPTSPMHLHSMGVTAGSADLMWGSSTDNVGVAYYEILRSTNGGAFSPVATAHDTSFLDTGLTSETRYQYKVVAFDAQGNKSPESNTLTVTTASDNTDPGADPAWSPTAHYEAGDRVTYNGATYEALASHTGHGDPNWITAPSLWKKL